MPSTEPDLQILIVGGDPSVWVAISSDRSLGRKVRASQIVMPRDLDAATLRRNLGSIDAIVVVTSPGDPDPCFPLRVIRDAGLHRQTVVLADGKDHRTASESLAIGVGAYLIRGAPPEKVSMAIAQVASGGGMFDAPAAHVLRTTANSLHPTGGAMGAARALASALELKDTYTGGHAERVTAMAMRLATASMLTNVIPSDALEAAFLLHDVGKIGIPESILSKTGPLTDTERRVLETHPILGERIIAPLGFPEAVRNVVRHHHERWDGTGYPDRLVGIHIPAEARVFEVADVLDAMTSTRPYRQPVSFNEALAEIQAHAGRQFDPALCEIAEDAFRGMLAPSLHASKPDVTL